MSSQKRGNSRSESAREFLESSGMPTLDESERNAHANKSLGIPIHSRRLESSASPDSASRPELFRDTPESDGRPHNAYDPNPDGLTSHSQYKTYNNININVNGCKQTLKMTQNQKDMFITYISAGMGMNQSCLDVGVTRQVLRNTMKDDPEFRDRVSTVDGSIDDQCEAVIYEQAVMFKDYKAAALLMGLRGKFRSERQSLAIARKSLNMKEKALNHVVSEASESINFAALTDQEINRYSYLYSLLSIGSGMTDAEKIEYADISAKLAAPVVSALPDGSRLIDVTSNVDAIFEQFDEN